MKRKTFITLIFVLSFVCLIVIMGGLLYAWYVYRQVHHQLM
ncbi:hypothetical protein Enr10x_29000 [Gimesia panareensis]|uniref:Uncharacterized protein n=1 Tax=Gimesia panareensis TaxID=2527978 RepID=A0A517Q7H3_9PLAN|nr:hypothetical protein [Gimesia panareensis]QDT27582.1 hypothetical protein Enr10x_29000 [Gimesia panareensis]